MGYNGSRKKPTVPEEPLSSAAPPSQVEQAAKAFKRRHFFSLRVKFILVLTALICLVMAAVTWLVLYQTRETLMQQILERGEAQVRSLALNSEEPLLLQLGQENPEAVNLTLMQFVRDAVAAKSAESVREIPSRLADWQKAVLDLSDRVNAKVSEMLWPGESHMRTGDVEYALITDPSGRIMAHNEIEKVIEQTRFIPPEGLRPLGDELILTQAYRGPDGRTYYDIAAPVRERSEGRKIGEVHLGMNQNTITRVVRYVAVAIILTTVAVLVLGILMMSVFVTFLVKPIGALVRGVSAIAAGDLNQEIHIRRSDELGDLTLAFNNMAKSLREKELIKGAFSKYVTKSVVDKILKEGENLKLGGGKKNVSIFFSDIRGFTPMSETLPAEEVVHLLNEYFTEMTRIIFKYEGTLDKFMGDAIMAVYGAPIEYPDHAERAVMAAIEMSQKMKELQAKWRAEGKKEVNIGIGINTGEVVVGNIGSAERMEYTAIGDNVNLAQRLESVAEKGQILISSACYEKVKHKVIAHMLDPIKLKGKSEKVVAYAVEGLRA